LSGKNPRWAGMTLVLAEVGKNTRSAAG